MVLKSGVFSFGLELWGFFFLKLMELTWIFFWLNRKRYVQMPILPDTHINTSDILEKPTNYILQQVK
jgi:hypothetical protein